MTAITMIPPGHDKLCERAWISDGEFTACDCRFRSSFRGPERVIPVQLGRETPPEFAIPATRPAVEPEATMPTTALVKLCDQYLVERRSTLWGESFEIISPKGRAEAAAWLADAIANVLVMQGKR